MMPSHVQAGVHKAEHRRATVVIDAGELLQQLGGEVDDSFFPALGYLRARPLRPRERLR